MKVVETGPDRLVIEDRPWLPWLTLPVVGLAALIGAISGNVEGVGALWVAWRFAPLQRFFFDRPANTFSHWVHRPTGCRTRERPLTDIRRAADEGNRSDGSRWNPGIRTHPDRR